MLLCPESLCQRANSWAIAPADVEKGGAALLALSL
jgi:hypothetical protein